MFKLFGRLGSGTASALDTDSEKLVGAKSATYESSDFIGLACMVDSVRPSSFD